MTLVLDMSVIEMSVLSPNIMGLDGSQLVVLKAPKREKKISKTQQQCLFPQIISWLIHRSCCDVLHVGTSFFLGERNKEIKHERHVDHLEQPGHGFWKERLILDLSF